MNRGECRDRITIEYPAPMQNSTTGEITYTWTFKCKAWANIQYLSARELMAAQQLSSVVVARMTIPWRGDLNANMRILHGGLTYNIAGLIPDNDSGREWLTIPVSSGRNAG